LRQAVPGDAHAAAQHDKAGGYYIPAVKYFFLFHFVSSFSLNTEIYCTPAKKICKHEKAPLRVLFKEI
jgi:hypothetical protein